MPSVQEITQWLAVGPLARILLRVLVGWIIARGWYGTDDGNALIDDPNAAMVAEWVLAGAIWVAVEGWYFLAKRWGWRT